MWSSYEERASSLPSILEIKITLNQYEPIRWSVITYKLNTSLNLGARSDGLCFVFCNLRLSARWGPIRFTSMNGLNVWVFGHLRSLAATTENERQWTVNSDHLWWSFLNRSLTFHSDLVLASPRMSVEVHLNWNLSGALVLVLFVCKQILLTLFCKHMFTIVYLPWLFWLWTKFLMSASVVWV